jgi:cellulose synthase/poly-beta-1,6-N-acetylglucosamine synthase-like glycosyltransferase
MAKFPIRLLNEPRRGVCIARNRAIPLSKGKILAFVDDDVVAHSNWLHELLKGFSDPTVGCVTGRVVPEGPVPLPEERIARYYSSERAMSFWSLTASDPNSYARVLGDPAGFGCNMAFRRDFLESCAMFPEDLGAGSPIGGDEFYMFVQVLRHGYRLQYTPSAVVTHYFEKDIANQKQRTMQLYAGSSAFATKLLIEEKGIRMALLKWGLAAACRRLNRFRARKKFSSEPQELLSSTEKMAAYFRGPWVYWKSRRAKESSLKRP